MRNAEYDTGSWADSKRENRGKIKKLRVLEIG